MPNAPHEIRHVAVLGGGLIGASWAAYFLSRGMTVAIYDPAPDAPAKIAKMIDGAWPALTELGLGAGADRTGWRHSSDPVDAVAGAGFVQEAGPERTPVKHALFTSIDAALDPEVVVATSTSGLLVSDMQAGLPHARRYLIGHPFNPPHLIPLVEVAGGRDTDPALVDWAVGFYRAIGKVAVKLNKEMPGHIANRLQAAIWREAVHLFADGVASVEDIDLSVAYGPGLRWALMGPTLTYHLGGGQGGLAGFIEHLGPAVEGRWDDLSEMKRIPREVVPSLVQGALDEAKGASIDELAADRDRLLIGLLKMIGAGKGTLP